MAKISRKVREIINIVIFFLVAGALLFFYMIYPLNRTAEFMSRVGEDDAINPDTLPANDPTAFVEAGFSVVDTFRVEADGLTNLALVYLGPDSTADSTLRGTVALLHDEDSDRTAMIDLARLLVDTGFAVIVYDQRAAGLSSGKYHGDGQYEATDLVETVGYLQLRNHAHPPLCAVGFSVGGEAALLAPHQDDRFDRMVAVNPYFSSKRMLDLQKEEHNALWFPFYRTLMWWWYGIRSGYAAPYRTIDDIQAVGAPTLVLVPDSVMAEPETARLQELSDETLLQVKSLPTDQEALYAEIIAFLTQ